MTHPELAQEALFDASTVVAGTHKKLPWRCTVGHEWEAVVKSRALAGRGCPVCGGQQVLPGFNDLATTHPELATEAVFDPTSVVAGTHKKLPWRCSEGHGWEAVVGSRAAGAGCPVCSGSRVWPGLNDLATLHPDVAEEALFDPSTVTASSGRRMSWRCTVGHEWEAAVSNRTAQGQGCPYCSNRRVLPGFNDLATTHPGLVPEALFDATAFTFGSSKRLQWRCSKGHEWTTSVAARASSGEGCSVCGGKTIVSGVNDLATTHPNLVSEALFDATTVIAGTHQKLAWRCSEGHEWKAKVKSRALAGRGCPFCSNKNVLPGFNDLATTHPELAMEALFDATAVTYGSSDLLLWRCSEGHEWKTAPNHRTKRNDGCPVCSNKKVLPGFNDLATTHPELAAEALFDPTKMTYGSHRKLSWKCTEGHEWATTVKARAVSGQGCPSCASTGYDPAEPGWVYLMHHPIWELLQVGITNDIEQRMKVHTRRGWEPLDARGPMPGDAARVWELSILNYLKSKKINLTASTSHLDPDPGNSTSLGEAWWASDYPAQSLSVLMEAVRESEWKDS